MTKHRLAIGIVTWNNEVDAIECAESLLKQTIAQDLVVVFIDNGSHRRTNYALRIFAEKHSTEHVDYFSTGYNGGTAGGFNAIVHYATTHGIEYVGSLNADAVADKRWCEALVAQLDDNPHAGIATGKLLHRDGKTIDTTGDFYTIWGIPGPRLRDQLASEAPKMPGEVFGATGGGFVARASMYNNIGPYDETLFMYFEDIDLSFRAQLMGYKVRYTPDAVAYHKRGASADTVPGLAVYNTFKNLPIVFVKNVPLRLCLSMYPRFVLAYTLILGNAIVRGRGIPAIKGWLMSWRYLIHMFVERRRIQASRTVDDAYISSIILHDIPPEQTGLRKFRQFFTGKP